MKCPVCKDYDFEHRLDLEKHSLSVHGVSAERLNRESASGKDRSNESKAAPKAASQDR